MEGSTVMNLTIGATTIVEIDLVDVDGNNINRDDCEYLAIEIRQYNRVLATYVFPDDEVLTEGTTDSKLKIEISQVLSAKFREGKVYARAIIENTDAEFVEDGEQKSLPDYHILTMYMELPDDNDDEVTVIDHYRGLYDASGDVAPSAGGSGTAGAILAGDEWVINVAGTIFGIDVNIGNRIMATVNNPGQTSGNWTISGNQS
jgi:hypothetical protein